MTIPEMAQVSQGSLETVPKDVQKARGRRKSDQVVRSSREVKENENGCLDAGGVHGRRSLASEPRAVYPDRPGERIT